MIFVFDFDKTLTSDHTQGTPDIEFDYFNEKQLKKVIDIMDDIKKTGNMAIILSRGNENKITEYLKIRYPVIYHNLHMILGTSLGLAIESVIESDLEWARWKADKLIMIQNQFPLNKIVFLDDTLINVQIANKIGFNAYHVIYNSLNRTTNIDEIYHRIISV